MKTFQVAFALFAILDVGQSVVIDSLTTRQTGRNLTILPFGDSITFGIGSSDGNGYRNVLHGLLDARANTVNMIGSIKAGTMADNDNEGHSGFTISQLANDPGTRSSLAQRPNVVLLHIGTNDMNLNSDTANAPTRLGSLIDQVFTASPDAVLIVAQIIASTLASTQSLIATYNAAVPGVVATRRNAGKKVLVVDMGSLLTSSDMSDFLHPNNQGYSKMANAWSTALESADALGFFDSTPGQTTTGATTTSVATTSAATSTTTQASTTTSAPGPAQTHWGQCGGQGWTGPTTCQSPYTCTVSNQWYSQCL